MNILLKFKIKLFIIVLVVFEIISPPASASLKKSASTSALNFLEENSLQEISFSPLHTTINPVENNNDHNEDSINQIIQILNANDLDLDNDSPLLQTSHMVENPFYPLSSTYSSSKQLDEPLSFVLLSLYHRLDIPRLLTLTRFPMINHLMLKCLSIHNPPLPLRNLLSSYTRLTHIEFSNIIISNNNDTLFLAPFHNPVMQEILIINCTISRDFIPNCAGLLQYNHTIKNLTISHCKLNSIDAELLLRSIHNHPTLQILDLSRNDIDAFNLDLIENFPKYVSHIFWYVNLSENPITRSSIPEIQKTLLNGVLYNKDPFYLETFSERKETIQHLLNLKYTRFYANQNKSVYHNRLDTLITLANADQNQAQTKSQKEKKKHQKLQIIEEQNETILIPTRQEQLELFDEFTDLFLQETDLLDVTQPSEPPVSTPYMDSIGVSESKTIHFPLLSEIDQKPHLTYEETTNAYGKPPENRNFCSILFHQSMACILFLCGWIAHTALNNTPPQE